ncbi:MAG: YcbK family protein [Myxococcales bacterium]|nr:YcbK family protein [Myxococcales bacterium]
MRAKTSASIFAWLAATALVRLSHAQPRVDGGAIADASVTSVASADAGSSAATAAVSRPTTADPRFAALPELTFRAINTRETVRARLYRADGTVDPAVVERLARLLRDLPTGESSPVVVRTLQLIVKVATHFDAREIEVVSAYRTGRSSSGRRVRREGYHGVGSAIDFRIPSVEPALIAAYARTFSHVGVGLYPRLGFVHIDSREQSFFWENRAGRSHHGWDRPLARDGVPERERSWSSDADLPWDPPGVSITLDTHPRTAPGAHRSRRHARRGRHHRRHRTHRRGRLPLHVFSGGGGAQGGGTSGAQ